MAPKNSQGAARRSSELLLVTPNELGTLARITAPLAKAKINIECYCGYEWNGEAAFRLVTDNNKKAADLLRREGYTVQENPVTLWQVENVYGKLADAATALAEAKISTFCSYSSMSPTGSSSVAAFCTNDSDRAVTVLNRIR